MGLVLWGCTPEGELGSVELFPTSSCTVNIFLGFLCSPLIASCCAEPHSEPLPKESFKCSLALFLGVYLKYYRYFQGVFVNEGSMKVIFVH